jgi:hypothetical protein
MRSFVLLLCLLGLASPALGQAQIDDLHISRDGEVVNIRVSLRNPGPRSQPGPLIIELFARPLGGENWQSLHTWSDISRLAAGYRVSRDFFSKDGDTATSLAEDEFEVRAVLSGPGLSQTVDKVAEHDPEHHH